jgi:hypothetical protein
MIQSDFATKVRWRMKFDKNEKFINLQDKLSVKEYARKYEVNSAKVYQITENPEELDFLNLPESYFIKANHGCEWNIICLKKRFYIFKNGSDLINEKGQFKESSELTDFELSQLEVIQKCKEWLSCKMSSKEWAYSFIKPKIFIEEYLTSNCSQSIQDFRFYVFNGCVKAINIGSPFFRKKEINAFFDTDWNLFHGTKEGDVSDEAIAKPGDLSEMLKIAKCLGNGLDFIRVDLYNSNRGILVGELTVYPNGGIFNSPSISKEFNKWLGEQWVISNKAERQMNSMFGVRLFERLKIKISNLIQ